ncbi:fusaric acid resistance protein [Acinetobacter sp. ANC 4470]|uniref:FUSC family protein n=1 Tax=Acinetobacter sp. ANC 4470 TaxID=1977881 RepID=UPI000A333377|nr:FUSC family protein [Acinetobacter sp. ANC 4470]OTG68801.1 fusaric acid resistance protein [Acinetobacter sp. ANC 4470]
MLLTKPLLAFRPSKLDWIFATKTFVAGMLALYIAFSLNLAYPIWAIGTVFVIANPYSGMTSSKSIYRLLGTLLGAIVSIAVTPFLINTPILFTLFLACWVGFCLYISMLDRTSRSYVSMLAGYTTVIICYNMVYYADTVSIFDMALGRFLEITVGVVCSAIVTTTIFPMHIGPAVETRVSKIIQDIKVLFDQILLDQKQLDNYNQWLGNITRDASDIHVLAVHLSYERSSLQGMTKPLQEMLHQLTMLVANLVAMSERMKQLDQIDMTYRENLKVVHGHIAEFLHDHHDIKAQELNVLPHQFESDFAALVVSARPEQQIILNGLKMDVRHFIQNVRAVKLIWQRIQQGNDTLPESITPLTTTYPSLHRDHGAAVRGGISAFITILIATSFWILSGWKAGFMMAEMAAICACILTAMDNPVPALKLFIRASIYSAVVVFIYAYGVFPHVTTFWELVLVLAPFSIFCLMLFPHPPLAGLGLPLLMSSIMGLNLQNHYMLDQITFFDASIGTVIGPIISVYVIHIVRAMSPDMAVQRILALHYKAVRNALYLSYGADFKKHLRSMLDRIGVLNSKAVQSEQLKNDINLALVETSTVIDLTRLQELINKLPQQDAIIFYIKDLQQSLDDYFQAKEMQQASANLLQIFLHRLAVVQSATDDVENRDIAQRLNISLNNIRSSLCHQTNIKITEHEKWVGI